MLSHRLWQIIADLDGLQLDLPVRDRYQFVDWIAKEAGVFVYP